MYSPRHHHHRRPKCHRSARTYFTFVCFVKTCNFSQRDDETHKLTNTFQAIHTSVVGDTVHKRALRVDIQSMHTTTLCIFVLLRIKGVSQALSLWAPSKTPNVHLRDTFWIGMGLLAINGLPKWAPFLMVCPAFSRSKKHECVKLRKTFKTPNESMRNACCLRHVFSRICFLLLEKYTLQKCFLFQNGPLLF